MEDTKIQWHAAFVSAMNLELAQNRADLIYHKEYLSLIHISEPTRPY